ncbi:ParB/RepB/Spo0J family partition protein [Streptomyces sp. NPDC056132]|uniref:ParB/RepB/Spo0J family partition protein n=1 Tax=Streptomyces sp. NPDC056132 TaxID=3345722 RepID=UPI0035D5EEC1
MAVKKPWADLLDGPGKPGSKRATTTEQSPKAETPPTTVYMHTLIGSPDNPRTEADYSDDDSDFRELKGSMQSVGQLQPAVAMSREAFLRVKPEHGARLGDAQWVVILGNRRFHAAKQLGWTKFEIRVRDRLGHEDDDRIDEAVVIENIHRKNIPPFKEAEFLQRMVERHGSQEKVAERIGKSQMYVSNRLSLLNLTPELRDAVDTKQIKVKTAEKIAKVQDPAEQKAIAAAEIRKAQQPKAPRRRATAPVSAPRQNPVLKTAADSAKGDAGAVGIDAAKQEGPKVPEPRLTESAVDDPAAGQLAWHEGAALMNTAYERLEPAQRSAFIQAYFRLSPGVDAVIEDLRGDLAPQDRASLAAILRQVADGVSRDG